MMDLEKKLKTYRLSRSEFDAITKFLKREPQGVEWAIYSALWSEHCSYKSSKVHLKKLFTQHPRVVQGPGENAGVIDLGMGERVAFKMESHNHPSFIEPTQGAATGVGGIIRDIFTMGARPMASMDYLCFGSVDHKLTPHLIKGVVGGIGGYGNCVGVPTVSGQTTFHESYNGNNLVNAFCLGLFRPGEEVFYGRAAGAGNWVVYAGARTGRDGVHGAAMASESFGENLEAKKPNVQIGDPFYEKLLIEACLEVMARKLVVGIQDMGAAGLTSSTFEMAARAKHGLILDLDKIPLREPDILPEEILLSESQERMVLVIEPSKYKDVSEVFNRWGLECSKIGEVVTGDFVELRWNGKTIAKMNHKHLVEEAPVYKRPFELPLPPKDRPIKLDLPESLEKEFVNFLSHPQVSSRHWIYEQYDQRVGAKTISGCEDGVALLRLPDSGRVVGMSVGCRPLLMEWHPTVGGADSVILPCLQLASRGVKALAITDCLNFGNPENPKVMGEFVAALTALDVAARKFDTPIISGNVSLYNDTLGKPIVGTPATGVVGIRSSISGPKATVKENQRMYLLKTKSESVWLGEFAAVNLKEKPMGEAVIHHDEVEALGKLLLDQSPIIQASQVIGRGGLATALFKMVQKGVGIEVDYFEQDRGVVEFLFGERFYSCVVSIPESSVVSFLDACRPYGDHVKVEKLGRTGGNQFRINHYLNISVRSLIKGYQSGWDDIIEKLA